jgi:hypothetical protein
MILSLELSPAHGSLPMNRPVVGEEAVPTLRIPHPCHAHALEKLVGLCTCYYSYYIHTRISVASAERRIMGGRCTYYL